MFNNSPSTAVASEILIPALLEQMHIESNKGRKVVPLAALCKRLGVRMSTVQRHLTALADHELVEVDCDEAGRWTTTLTTHGKAFCDSVAA
jgi:DNA-binding MarR family transcriptional regulator